MDIRKKWSKLFEKIGIFDKETKHNIQVKFKEYEEFEKFCNEWENATNTIRTKYKEELERNENKYKYVESTGRRYK